MPENSGMDPRDINTNSRLRASDADRDQAAKVLGDALAEGRLTADEHAERLDSVYAAKTQADLVPVIDDLPAKAAAASPGTTVPATRGGRFVAIFGGISRKGQWHPDPVTKIVVVFGGADLDLRDAILPPSGEITLHVIAVFGGADIKIPPEMRVIDTGTAIMGGRDITGDVGESDRPGAPVLRITGTCVFGGISVSRKARKNGGPGQSWPQRIQG
jgi:Domain of unknown function (DUF1707)